MGRAKLGIIVAIFFIIVFGVVTIFFSVSSTQYASPDVSDITAIHWQPYPPLALNSGVNRQYIERGEYLVKMGDCISCHTQEHGKPFAGGRAIKTKFGIYYSSNITPDKQTGIGSWADEDFIRAMHKGISPHGKYYFPVFPYTSFTKITKQDLYAIRAYLNTIPAVHQENKIPQSLWPFDWRLGQWGWRILYFSPGYYQYDPDQTPTWNRGAYLLQGLGHCGECHTPRNRLGAMKMQDFLKGAQVGKLLAPDITNLDLEDKNSQKLVALFKKMEEIDHDSLSFMSEVDLNAIMTYLATLGEPQTFDKKNIDSKRVAEGEKTYLKVCTNCHEHGAAGAPIVYDSANWATRLKQGLPTLNKHALNGFNMMPPKGGCPTCSNDEVKAAIYYMLATSQTSAHMAVKNIMPEQPNTSLALGKKVYDSVCSLCHNSGSLGAPKLGDEKAWSVLAKKNVDVLILNTLNGVGNMPPKGGCSKCKNSDVIAAVKYMMQQANPKGDYTLW